MKLTLVLALLACGGLQEKEPPRNAKELLNEAVKQAKEGKKRVLLTFGAPG